MSAKLFNKKMFTGSKVSGSLWLTCILKDTVISTCSYNFGSLSCLTWSLCWAIMLLVLVSLLLPMEWICWWLSSGAETHPWCSCASLRTFQQCSRLDHRETLESYAGARGLQNECLQSSSHHYSRQNQGLHIQNLDFPLFQSVFRLLP